ESACRIWPPFGILCLFPAELCKTRTVFSPHGTNRCFMAGNRMSVGASRKSAAGGGGSDTRAALHLVARPMARRREAREARVAGECRRGGGAPRHRASEAPRDVFGANGGGVPSPESNRHQEWPCSSPHRPQQGAVNYSLVRRPEHQPPAGVAHHGGAAEAVVGPGEAGDAV